jgi:hypothetical protein
MEEIFHARPSDVDPDEARRQELVERELAGRGGAVAKIVLPG